jgi:peptidoglycan/LPS O-acetylase OafA/YrhL
VEKKGAEQSAPSFFPRSWSTPLSFNRSAVAVHRSTEHPAIPIRTVPRQIPALTGVRFVAALWVVLYHDSSRWPEIARPIIDVGFLAVPFFFILSGFILTHTYPEALTTRSYITFLQRRFARLWPVHFVTLLVLIGYSALVIQLKGHSPNTSYVWSALLSELLMMRAWAADELLWNYPAWSIHAEWFAYLLLFPICAGLRSLSQPWLRVLAAAFILLQSVLPLNDIPGHWADIVLLFPAGACLYHMRKHRAWPHAANVGLFVVTFVLAGYLSRSWLFLAFAAIVFGLSVDGWLTWILSRRAFVNGGTISYSLYMTHAIVLSFYNAALKPLEQRVGHIPDLFSATGFVVIAIGIAALTYHAVEAPAQRWIRSLERSHRVRKGQETELVTGRIV